MADEAQWLTPSIVVPAISVLIASVVVPLLLHWLRGRREQAARIFEVRREVYSQYFKKYEDAAAGVGNDYEKFSQVTLKEEFYKLLQAENSPEAIVAFQSAVGEVPHKIQDAYRKATEETTVLKILGSSELLVLTQRFEELNQEILNMSTEWLAEFRENLTKPDMEGPVAKEMKQKGEQTRRLKEQIINQMRKELGVGG